MANLLISDDGTVKLPEDSNVKIEDDLEDLLKPPDWLPDGWIMEVYRGDDGSIQRYYSSPVSMSTFTMKAEVLEYLFLEVDQIILDSRVANKATFQETHDWLPKGWFLEVRAGGKKMDKMYKFYVYPSHNVRVFTKEEVLLYVSTMKISKCDTEGQCNTESEDNILAIVEFSPSMLPHGWVKEVVFRKTKEGFLRKDPYYTDPVSHYVFRTLKSALCFLETGKVTKRAFFQKFSVHDMYSFQKCTDLHERLRKRLTIHWTVDPKTRRKSTTTTSLLEKTNVDDQTTYSSENGDTSSDSESTDEPNEVKFRTINSTGEGANSSRTIRRPRGKPHKVVEDADTSSDLDPSYEPEETEYKAMKYMGKEANSSKTIRCQRGRPPKMAEASDTATELDSPHKAKQFKPKTMKSTGKESGSSKIIKRPRQKQSELDTAGDTSTKPS